MKTLYILRHAKASHDFATYTDDHTRPLTEKGQRQSHALGAYLQHKNTHVDTLLCSSAKRTQETTDYLLQNWTNTATSAVKYEPSLYLAAAEDILTQIRMLDDGINSAMVVGHNPGLHLLALHLSKPDGPYREKLNKKFPTCALAVIESQANNWWDFAHKETELTALTFAKELLRADTDLA